MLCWYSTILRFFLFNNLSMTFLPTYLKTLLITILWTIIARAYFSVSFFVLAIIFVWIERLMLVRLLIIKIYFCRWVLWRSSHRWTRGEKEDLKDTGHQRSNLMVSNLISFHYFKILLPRNGLKDCWLMDHIEMNSIIQNNNLKRKIIE